MSARSTLSTLGWAAYLACSWTWCIGMFLPILLVRDFGVWGFVVFAVPNVIGAAAFGWVLARPGASEKLVEKHRPWLRGFSFITIAFQVYFLIWMMHLVQGELLYVAIGAAFGAMFLPRLPFFRSRIVARTLLVLPVSVAAIVVFLSKSGPSFPPMPQTVPPDLLWLAPVCGFGFALCPYLDLTFHHARQKAPGPSGTIAFTLGFGVIFLAMILFTLAYSGFLDKAVADNAIIMSIPAVCIVAHLFVQLIYTFEVHHERAITSAQWRNPTFAGAWAGLVGIGLMAFWAIRGMPTFANMEITVIVYRIFLSFYSLVFPVYVWLIMIPTRDGHSGTAGANGRRKLMILMLVIGIAAPMYWMGFIMRHEFYLVPGVLIILLSRLALPRPRTANPA